MKKSNLISTQQTITYTHELPYQARKDLCDLLDFDDSCRRLGGEFMGLDSITLGLVEQAIQRKGSRTEELLKILDLENKKINELYTLLERMNHRRAMEILRPFLSSTGLPKQPIMRQAQRSPSEPKQSVNPFPEKCHRGGDIAPEQFVGNSNVALDMIVRKAIVANGTTMGQNEINPTSLNQVKKRTSLNDQCVIDQLRLIMQITYEELRLATGDFSESNILGNGGFASVYRGVWKGTDVAIKRLRCNLMDQALNELTILNSYRIDNILPIYGISFDGPEACLVYQFMVNGSLDDRLSCKNNSKPLNWNQRATIGEGIAKGLFYLHTLRSKPIVHGDVKSANVLLDAQFIPKLGDFGLSRQDASDGTHCTVSSIHGTSVYLPPEYLRHKMLSSAVDVYSYGIVMLEMATGRRAYDGKRLLIDLVEDEMRSTAHNQISYNLKDPRLKNNTQTDLKIWYELLIKLGLACANKNKRKRPDMARILEYFANFRTRETRSAELAMMNIKQSISQTSDCTGFRVAGDLRVGGTQEMTTVEAKSRPREDQPEVVSLMDVDIEQANHDKASEDDCPPVEPIIPLLTELGIVQGDDYSTER